MGSMISLSTETQFLLGAGGHARVLLDGLLLTGITIDGILDPDLAVGTLVRGLPVLGNDDYLLGTDPSLVVAWIGVGASPSTQRRRTVFEHVAAQSLTVGSFIHPTATISSEATLARGAQVMAGAVIQTNASVGRNAIINANVTIEHDCVVGDHAAISSGAILCGNVGVGESAFVGAGAVVLPGVTIGAGACVGAGAVVTKNVEVATIVYGNPAAPIGKVAG